MVLKLTKYFIDYNVRNLLLLFFTNKQQRSKNNSANLLLGAVNLIKMKKALLDKIIVSLQESRDAWIGKEGEVARQNYKDGISSAISAIEQIRLHSEFEEVARELMKFMAERHHPHTRVILNSTNAELLEGLQSTGQVFEYVID